MRLDRLNFKCSVLTSFPIQFNICKEAPTNIRLTWKSDERTRGLTAHANQVRSYQLNLSTPFKLKSHKIKRIFVSNIVATKQKVLHKTLFFVEKLQNFIFGFNLFIFSNTFYPLLSRPLLRKKINKHKTSCSNVAFKKLF